MWRWPPASSAPSIQPSAYPHMQHIPTHPSFPTTRLTTPPARFSSSQPSYYPSPNVGYSAQGSQLVPPQTLPLTGNWAGGHLRSPVVADDNMTYLQTPQQQMSDPATVMHSPGPVTPNNAHHSLQETAIQNTFTPKEDLYQRGIFAAAAPPSAQSAYQASPSTQQQSGHVGGYQGTTPSPMHTYHQPTHSLSTDSHTPAFQSPPQGLPTAYQSGMEGSNDFQRTPSSSSPFQPPRLIEGSMDHHPPELVAGSVEPSSGGLISGTRDGLGYTVTGGHAHSSPFSVDFLLRDRSTVDGELSSDQQQSGYQSYPPQHHTDTSTLLTLPPLSHPTEEDERPFSPPELVPIETTLNKEPPVESHDSHKDVSQCHMTNSISSNKSSAGNEPQVTSEGDDKVEEESVPFQLAEPGVQTQNQAPKSPSPVDPPQQPAEDNKTKKDATDKYISPLIRHQCNRGYESSDDDDVFLPNPILTNSKPKVTVETADTPQQEEEAREVPEVVVSKPSVPPLEKGTVVIKRGRGTAKTLDLQKLQLPLSQGWRRLVRKRVGADQIRVDICYIAPGGRRLRTFPEIQSHLDSTHSSELTLDHYTFSKKVDLGEVLDGVIGETSPRGRRGRGRGRGRAKTADLTRQENADGSPSTHTPPSGRGRGRGRGGRGRGGRPRKTAESATRGEPSQLATHSARAPPVVRITPQGVGGGGQELDGSVHGIGAVSTVTARALIQKAIKRTNLESKRSEPDHLLDKERGLDARLHTQERDLDAGLPVARERSLDVRLAPDGERTFAKELPLQVSATTSNPTSDVSTTRSTLLTDQVRETMVTATPPTTTPLLPPAMIPDRTRTPNPVSEGLSLSQSSEDGLSVLSTSAISTQVFSTAQATPTSYAFHMHTPSSIGTSLQGAGRTSGRGRGRKRKSQTRPSSSDPPVKRPRGRPKGSGTKAAGATTGEGVKKRRGRKPKVTLPNTSHTILRPLAPSPSVAMTMDGAAPPTTVVDGGDGTSVIVSSGEGEEPVSMTAKIQEEKRRQLLLKARADKARKKEARNFQRSLVVNQRKLAQRQRRDRERQLMRQAREKQEKLTRQREVEDREMRRQTAARQREVDNQRRARERTVRLLAHLKQQEMERSRRLYQQQLEMEKMAQLKRPVEDLEVRESSALPLLPSLGWVQLPSQAFAELLMVLEFGRSFTEFLELEGGVPSLPDVYLALYNHNEGVVVMKLLVQLFKAVLYDPGTRALTRSGSQLEEVVVTPLTVSELLRLYLRSEQTASELTQITCSLDSSPLQCLRPSQKVKVLSYLVEELLDSASLTREVDTRMEQLASLRREKWKISLKMKRFRSRLSTVYGVGEKTRPIPYSGRGRPPKRAVMGGVTGDAGETSDEGEEGEEDGGGVASDSDYSEEPSDEETPEAKEELQQRLKALKKKFISVRKRIHSCSRLMRKFPLGQDRYARQYWVLPSVGGVIVEGVETSLDTNLQVMDGHSSDKVTAQVGVAEHGVDQSEGVGVASQKQSNDSKVNGDEHVSQHEPDQSDCSKDPHQEAMDTESRASHTNTNTHEVEEEVKSDVTPKVHDEGPLVSVPPLLNSDPQRTPSPVVDHAHSGAVVMDTQTTPSHQASELSPSTRSQSPVHAYPPQPSTSPEYPSPQDPQTTQNSDPNTIQSSTPQTISDPHTVQNAAPQTFSEPPIEEPPTTSLACSESMNGEESKDSAEVTAYFVSTQTPWFSLAPRHPCEVTHLAYQSQQQQQPQQQQYVVTAPTAQYAYVTPDGQVLAAAGVQGVGMSYGLVGNTLVQMPQNQYIAVDSSTGMVLGQQGTAGVQYAVTGSEGGTGVRYLAVGGTPNYVTVGGGGQMIVQTEGGGQMVVVQDQSGQQSLVSLPGHNPTGEESGKQVTAVKEKTPSEDGPPEVEVKGHVSIKREEVRPEVVTSPQGSALRVKDGEEVAPSEGVKTVSGEELVSHDNDKQQSGEQYVTAVVPGGPDGTPRYVSLPADPRVLSGQCSYAVLQQTDGSQQIVLVDNNSIGAYQGGADNSSSVVAMETPPPSLMDNEREGEGFVTAITLMYAQEPLSYLGGGSQSTGTGGASGSKDKGLRELLEEQHIDLTHGWWSVTRPETIDRLLRTLCTRGVREKYLTKHLQKNKDLITTVLNPSFLESFKTLFRDHMTSLEKPRPVNDDQSKPTDSGEEKKSVEPETCAEGVKMDTNEERSVEQVKPEMGTNDVEVTNQNGAEQSCDMNNPTFPGYCVMALLTVVEYLEGMQQRLLTAQLHNEGVEAWESLRSKVSDVGHTPQTLLLISENLLGLERSISRVHLKPPLRDKKLYQEEQERNKDSKSRHKRERPSLAVRRESTQLELPSDTLQKWRQAVGVASSASQLAVCMSELEVCIAWEKSNTIVVGLAGHNMRDFFEKKWSKL